jgi:hypothetical protein
VTVRPSTAPSRSAPADGYTLGLAGLPAAINATLYGNLNFIHDIAPVGGIERMSLVMAFNPALPESSRGRASRTDGGWGPDF